jgi:hypothetical protein
MINRVKTYGDYQDQRKGKTNNNNKQLHLKEVMMQGKVLLIIKQLDSLQVIKIHLKQLTTLFNIV